MGDGLEYFSSIWNINDMVLLIATIAASVLEFIYKRELPGLAKKAMHRILNTIINHEITKANHTVAPIDHDKASTINHELSTVHHEASTILNEEFKRHFIDRWGGERELFTEHLLKQYIRMIYVILILSSFLKVLNVA